MFHSISFSTATFQQNKIEELEAILRSSLKNEEHSKYFRMPNREKVRSAVHVQRMIQGRKKRRQGDDRLSPYAFRKASFGGGRRRKKHWCAICEASKHLNHVDCEIHHTRTMKVMEASPREEEERGEKCSTRRL